MNRCGLFLHYLFINLAGKSSGVDSKCGICVPNIQPSKEHSPGGPPVSLSKSTIKRRLHKSKYRGYTTKVQASRMER